MVPAMKALVLVVLYRELPILSPRSTSHAKEILNQNPENSSLPASFQTSPPSPWIPAKWKPETTRSSARTFLT